MHTTDIHHTAELAGESPSMAGEAVRADSMEFRKALGRAAEAIGREFEEATVAEKAALAKLVSAGVSQCFGPELAAPLDRERAITAKFWASLMEFTRNPRIKAAAWVPWLSAAQRHALSQEARGAAIARARTDLPVFGRSTEVAAEWVRSSQAFFAWAEEALMLSLSRDVDLTYLHYAGEGHFCRAHIDRPDTYEYNCLLCLEHDTVPPATRQSELRIFTGDRWLGYALPAGAALLFHSSSTIHGRTPMMEGETMLVLSIGLRTQAAGA